MVYVVTPNKTVILLPCVAGLGSLAHFSDSGDSSNQEDEYESEGGDSEEQEGEELSTLDEQLERRTNSGKSLTAAMCHSGININRSQLQIEIMTL